MATSIGLKVYDVLAAVEGNDKRKMLSKKEALNRKRIEFQLAEMGLTPEKAEDLREQLKESHWYVKMEKYNTTKKQKIYLILYQM